MSFNNKVVIVTGAGSGIGAAAATLFAKEKANVVMVDLNEESMKLVSAYFVKSPLMIKADISDEEQSRSVVQKTIDKFGQIDVLVNNAGIVRNGKLMQENLMKNYDALMNINLRAVIFLTNEVVPHLIKSQGNVVNVTSTGATTTTSVPRMGFAYSVSKAGLEHFTRAAAVELAGHGVRVNSVSPGAVMTNILKNNNITRDPGAQVIIAPLKGKEVSMPEDIAEVIVFVASDKARAVTGATYTTDCGLSLR